MAGRGNCSQSDVLCVAVPKNKEKENRKAPIPAESKEPRCVFIKMVFFRGPRQFLDGAEIVQYSGPVGSIPAAAVAALGFLMVVTLGSCREASDAAPS